MNTWNEIRGFPLAIRLLLVNQLGVNTGFYLLVPYLATHLGDDLGMSAAVVGIVLGVRNLSQQGLFLIGGSAADRLGARGVIIAGCAIRTVGFALFALGDGLPVLLAASVLSGVAGALFNPAVRTYLAQEAGERRAEAFALFNVFATTGALIGPLLGSALLLVDFRASALTAAGIFALLTVAQALVLPARQVPPATGSVTADWREAVGNRAFLAFALAMVGMFTLENQLYLLLPAGARHATGWDGAAGLVFLVGTIAGIAFQLRITRALSRRGTRGRWIAAGLVLMGLAFVPPMLVAGDRSAPGRPPGRHPARPARAGRSAPAPPGSDGGSALRHGADPRLRAPGADRHVLRDLLRGLRHRRCRRQRCRRPGHGRRTTRRGRRPRRPAPLGLLPGGRTRLGGRGDLAAPQRNPAPDTARPRGGGGMRHRTGNLLTDNPELYEARFPDPEHLAGRWAQDILCRHGSRPHRPRPGLRNRP